MGCVLRAVGKENGGPYGTATYQTCGTLADQVAFLRRLKNPNPARPEPSTRMVEGSGIALSRFTFTEPLDRSAASGSTVATLETINSCIVVISCLSTV